MLIEIFLTFLTLYIIWQAFKKPSNYPPGYWGLPLVGYIPLFSKKSTKTHLQEMKNKYGDVVSWRFGTKLTVFVNDYNILKEAFMGHNFTDRPDLRFFNIIISENNYGLIASNGLQWHNARRFSLRHLRNLGMGKSRLVMAVQSEASELVESLKKQAGKPQILPSSINISVLNVIWQLIASKRYDLDDNNIHKFENLIKSVQNSYGLLVIPDLFPWLNYIIPSFLLKLFTREQTRVKFTDEITSFIKVFIEEHKETLDPQYTRDYIDAYLIEMETQNDDTDLKMMSIDDLIVCIADLFFAGSETTTETLKWAILYLANYPEVQKKLQKEIDEILPKGTLATLEDRIRLPYTDATIHETLRVSSLAELGAIHMAVNNTTLGGYTIPKGAYIVGQLSSYHEDPKYFDSPSEFRPERFLDSKGKFSNPKDGFLPFGVGKRQCIGESLARMELLVFLTTLVQNLNFESPSSKKVDIRPQDISFMNLARNEEILITIR